MVMTFTIKACPVTVWAYGKCLQCRLRGTWPSWLAVTWIIDSLTVRRRTWELISWNIDKQMVLDPTRFIVRYLPIYRFHTCQLPPYFFFIPILVENLRLLDTASKTAVFDTRNRQKSLLWDPPPPVPDPPLGQSTPLLLKLIFLFFSNI